MDTLLLVNKKYLNDVATMTGIRNSRGGAAIWFLYVAAIYQ